VFKFRKLFVDILNFRKLYNLNNENSIEVSSLDLQQKTSNNVSFSILLERANCFCEISFFFVEKNDQLGTFNRAHSHWELSRSCGEV